METLVWMVLLSSCVGTYGKQVAPCSTPLPLAHGTYRLSRDTHSVEYGCESGYFAYGDTHADCDDGQWSVPPVACVAPGCEGLLALANGYLTLSYSGAVASFRCNEGFTLSGLEVIVCDGRSWNGTQPECEDVHAHKFQTASHKHHSRHRKDNLHLLAADYSCIQHDSVVSPPHVVHAVRQLKWSIVEERPRLYINFRCKWGFTLSAEYTTMYCRDRQWVGKLPRCVTEVPTKQAVSAYLQGDDPNTNPQSHDDWVRFSDYTCFNAQRAPTAPEVAHALTLPRYKYIDGSLHLYVQYECQPGYSIQSGHEYLYCKEKDWRGVVPTCRVDWNDPRLPSCERHNGGCAHTCSMAKGRVECGCQIGFRLATDGLSCEDVNECETNNGGCVQLCSNTQGHFRCECKSGFYLSLDGRSCLEKKHSSTSRDKPPLVLFHV